jgi:hypothetical protein
MIIVFPNTPSIFIYLAIVLFFRCQQKNEQIINIINRLGSLSFFRLINHVACGAYFSTPESNVKSNNHYFTRLKSNNSSGWTDSGDVYVKKIGRGLVLKDGERERE